MYSTLPLLESYHPLWPPAFLHFSPNGGFSLAGGCRSTFWNTACCIRNEQVEPDAPSCFNRTATLTHDPFQIRFMRGPPQPYGQKGSCISALHEEPSGVKCSADHVHRTEMRKRKRGGRERRRKGKKKEEAEKKDEKKRMMMKMMKMVVVHRE